MAELTPMKMQYQQIKSQYSDCLLFFRLGDFYEMFDEDARVASRELDLALTTRDRSVADPEQRTPMCGVPYHSCQTYIARLIAKGYKVAICEQIEDPATAKGLVKRDVIRIITPGTVTDASMLEEGKSNYLGAVYYESGKCAAAFCDISTGEFCVAAFEGDNLSHVLNELGRFAPRELIMNKGAAETKTIPDFAQKKLGCLLEMGGDDYEYMACAARVCEQFGVQSTDELGLGEIHRAALELIFAERAELGAHRALPLRRIAHNDKIRVGVQLPGEQIERQEERVVEGVERNHRRIRIGSR